MINSQKILLLAHCGEDFYKARLSFALFLKSKGFQVYVMVPQDEYTEKIREHGFEVGTTSLERDNVHPLNLFKAFSEVAKFATVNELKIVHSFKFIPNIVNVFSNLFSKRKVVLHIAGLGIAFANKSLKYQIIKQIFRILFFIQFLRANLVIIQNPDDYNDFLFKKSFRNKIKVVKGSGVDIQYFTPKPIADEPREDNKIVFLCTTRLIWEKGIRELVSAVELLPVEIRSVIKILIIGEPDDKNPRAVTTAYTESFRNHPVISFLGKKSNIKEYLHTSDVFILPSYYREGIPRSILEALSCGLPVITTKVPGCNLTVEEGKNGFLINPRSKEEIKDAIIKIIDKKSDWSSMGKYSREKAIKEFSEEVIYSEIVNLYTA